MEERSIFEVPEETEVTTPKIWKWFVALLSIEYDGFMGTDYATINYVTCDDLIEMEREGHIERVIDANKGIDIIRVVNTSLI